MEEAVVLYPSPAMGHLISMVELGKFMLSHRPSLSIHILLATPPYSSAGSTSPYISSVSASYSSIKFHHFPTTTLPSTDATHHETLTFKVLLLSNPHVHSALLSISHTHSIKAFILDSFCACSLPVASKLNIPPYYYFTSPAGCLAYFIYLSTLHQQIPHSFKQLGTTLVNVPGIPSVPARDFPKPLLDRNDDAYRYFLDFSLSLPKSSGILVNTFEALEARAVKAIRDGHCSPHDPTPPLYCIGPLIALAADQDRRSSTGILTSPPHGHDNCMTWLDSQPSKSVLFLCFGSLGVFSKEQLREIAVGLEKSEQRFLWVVRNPPPDNNKNKNDEKEVVIQFGKAEPEDLESLLPEGFLERTKGRGLVVKSWAPQAEVLNHEAVGGFVTHCGWNSVLEALQGGVPMVAWPLYAEQKLNKALLVEEIGIALPIQESSSSDGFVGWEEVEKRAREVMNMDSERGKLIRERTLAIKQAATAALSQGGGSSIANLSTFFHSCNLSA